MLNANEATASLDNLTYPASTEGTKETRQNALLAYKAGIRKIEGRFAAFLANEYASDLPEHVQKSIWEDARDEAIGSFNYLETHYADFANEARES